VTNIVFGTRFVSPGSAAGEWFLVSFSSSLYVAECANHCAEGGVEMSSANALILRTLDVATPLPTVSNKLFVDRFYVRKEFVEFQLKNNKILCLGPLPPEPGDGSPFSVVGPSLVSMRQEDKTWDQLLQEVRTISTPKQLNVFWKRFCYKWPRDKRSFEERKKHAESTLESYKEMFELEEAETC
jgi:hypothetical protein